jgi:hypothetical protein
MNETCTKGCCLHLVSNPIHGEKFKVDTRNFLTWIQRFKFKLNQNPLAQSPSFVYSWFLLLMLSTCSFDSSGLSSRNGKELSHVCYQNWTPFRFLLQPFDRPYLYFLTNNQRENNVANKNQRENKT